MDSLGPLLQETGILKVISEEEAKTTRFAAVLFHEEKLSDPRDRFNHYANVLQSWKEKAPTLKDPGKTLCNSCRKIDLENICSTGGYIHSDCYWALVASAEVSRCPMCVLMVNALKGGHHQGDLELSMKLLNPFRTDFQIGLRAIRHDERQDRDSLEVTVLNSIPVVAQGRISMTTTPGSISAKLGFLPAQPLNEAQKFVALEKWLLDQNNSPKSADESEEYVEDAKIYPTLPTRVLDVGSYTTTLKDDVCLVETNSLSSKNLPYVALSYRWGDTNTLTTTKTTLGDRLLCIAFKDMPKTIQDAVIVTRRLKVRYLWVDALCIIQDDKSEWLREATKMGETYMNSYCTIAAHSAQHAGHGFLEQSLSGPEMIQLGGRCEEEEQVNVFGRGSTHISQNPQKDPALLGDQYSTSSGKFWVWQGSNVKLHIESSELSTRGWILQERLLSQRTIHFAGDGAIYLETTTSLQDIYGVREPIQKEQFRGPGIQRILQQAPNRNTDPTESELSIDTSISNVYRDWYRIVERYSRCSLTKPDDKFPALTGILRQISTFTKDKCYMGIWTERMPQCLLWLRGKEALQLQQTYRAPSWSWAAVNGEVQFPIWKSDFDDREICQEFGSAQFASVTSAEDEATVGILRGPTSLIMRRVYLLRNPSFPTGHPNGGTGVRFLKGQVGKPSWIQIYNFESLMTETMFWSVHDDAGMRIGWAALDREERTALDGEEEKITCIAIASHKDDKPERGFVRGFLVLVVKLLRDNIWTRVGMGQITESGWFEKAVSSEIVIV